MQEEESTPLELLQQIHEYLVIVCVVQEEESSPLELLQRIHEYLVIVCVVQEEESTPLELLQRIHKYHEAWLLAAAHPLPAPVSFVDSSSYCKSCSL